MAKDEFSCEPCCRGFSTQEALDSHLSEHVTCGIEGCTLSAHSRILDVHIRYQHRTGLFKQISGAEVEKWIMDRKKLFPTLKTVMEKEQAKKEMDKRGETYTMSTSSRNGSNCSALNTKTNIQMNDHGNGSNLGTQANLTISNPSMNNSRERLRTVKRGGKNKKKLPQRTQEKEMCDDENEEESGPSFVKIKKFCGLGTLFERSSNIVNENTKNTMSYPNKSLSIENSAISLSNDKLNIKFNEDFQMIAQSNDVFRESNAQATKESIGIVDHLCNGKVQSNMYKSCSNEVAKPVSDYLSEIFEIDDVNQMNQRESISTDIIEASNTHNEINSNQVVSSHILGQEVSKSTEMYETNRLKNEVTQQVGFESKLPQNSVMHTKGNSKVNLNHLEGNSCNGSSTIELNDSVCIIDETCQEMDTNNALTTFMASYVDDESEMDEDEPPTESPICKSEKELESSSNKYDEITVNTGKKTSDISTRDSKQESNGKRRNRDLLAVGPTNESCERTALRRKKTGVDLFDTFVHARTTLRRHRGTNLLEKLLENDIVHERNVILQCAHYIVKNKFFGEI